MKNLKLMMLSIVAVICAATFVSCEKTEEPTIYLYDMGFTTVEGDMKVFKNEMGEIQDAFMTELGVSELSFVLNGSQKDCDKKVVAACQRAEQSLAGREWGAKFEFTVTNITADKNVVYKFSNM